MGTKGDWDFRISGLVKTLMELIFNPCGEFCWSPEGSVSQIHSPHHQVGAPGIFYDLLKTIQMLKREWGAESNGKSYRTNSIPDETATLVPEMVMEDLPSAELQSGFLRLQWSICPCTEHSDDDDKGVCMQVVSKGFWKNKGA